MPRYAVLLDPQDRDLRPIALVTEHPHEVRVNWAEALGLKTEYREPYQVTEPDGPTVRYDPGQPEYFNSVINTLSRGFVVNELEPVDSLDMPTLFELFIAKVVLPRGRIRGEYFSARAAHPVYVAEDTSDEDYDPAAQAAGPLFCTAA